MKLISIVLSGFKSFAERTEIKLDSGITAVVGPNGCGKSNVSDAVRWVMGESRASRLRQDNTADIIFNGCSTRAASDWCSVEMRLHNDSKRDLGMWSNYAELSIRRQVDRGGDSNYFINGQRVRRRDVTDLFAGTGSGARSYGIVAQEQITHIVQSDPQNLRALLEDAAGVSTYKERRKETERRLVHSQDNLERLEDLAGELRQRVKTLAKQAKLADTVRQTEVQLNHVKCLELVYRLEQLQEISASAKIQLDQASEKKGVVQQQLINQEDKLRQARTVRQHKADKLPKLQGAHYEASSELERVRQQIREDEIVHQQNQQMYTDTEAAIKVQLSSEKQITNDLKDLNTKVAAAAAQHEQTAKEELTAKRSLSKYQSDFAKARQNVELQQITLNKAIHFEREATSTKKLAEQRETDNKLLLASAEQELTNLAPADKFDQRSLEALRESAATAKQEAQNCAARLQKSQDDLLELREEFYRFQSKIGGMKTEQQLLENVAGEHQQRYGQWLKDNNITNTSRIVERALFEAEGLECAVDAALAVLLNGFEVDDLAKYSKSEDLPEGLVLVNPNASTSTNARYKAHSHMQLLIDKITCPQLWQATLANWLSGVYLAADHATALVWQKQIRAGEMVVTADGRCYYPAAICVPDKRGSKLQLQSQLKRVAKQIAVANDKFVQLQQRLDNQKISYAKLVAQSKQLASVREKTQQKLAESEREAMRCAHTNQFHADQTKRLSASIVGAKEMIKQQKQLAEQAFSELQKASGDVQEASDLHQKLGVALADCEAQLEGQREVCARLSAALRESQLSATHEQQRVVDLQNRLSEHRQQLADNRQRSTQIKAQFKLRDTDRFERELKAVERKVVKTKQALEKMEYQAQEASKQEVIAEQEMTQIRQGVEQQSQACHQLEIDFTGRSSEARAVQAQIEQFNINPQDLENTRRQCGNADQASRLAEKLRSKIDNVGEVNYAAEAEHVEAQQRLEQTQVQMDDLGEAMEALRVAIGRIDQEMLARLKQVFSNLNLSFDTLFKNLFEGGSAALNMTGDSLLSAGLRLDVCPPGKRVSNIQALSGGEKTLVGLAFLFALNELNSPPFCILDEADAALDEANTLRFSRLVDAMRSKTQFLIITHNRAVMENVERMIGITQEQKGISKVVSVKMKSLLDNAHQVSDAVA